MSIDIKICGLKTPEAIAAVLARGASHVGFIHFSRSPRHLSVEEMAALRPAVEGAKLVVVTVDADDALIDAILAQVKPDMLQLHGSETPARVAEIRERSGLPVIKAISIGSAEDVAGVAAYRDAADLLLLDAKKPKGSDLPGGNGVSFDWALLAALDPGLRYMLSGGLDAGNVAAALRQARPGGVDISSGVERAPGAKDIGLIHGFFDVLAAEALQASSPSPQTVRDEPERMIS